MDKRLSTMLLTLCILGSSHGQFTDSVWIVGSQGAPGQLVSVDVWLQYGGGGSWDSIASFDIPLTWDAAVCTVEAITIGTDFVDGVGLDWVEDLSRIDNGGTQGLSAICKVCLSALTLGPPVGAPWVEGGTHLAATIDFRILDTATPWDSTYIDTLWSAFTPSIYPWFAGKLGTQHFFPGYVGGWVVAGMPGDVGPTSIVSPPDSVCLDYIYTPSAMIANFGTDSIGPVPVICDIGSWSDTAEIPFIPGMDSSTVGFANWTVPDPGIRSVTVFTEYGADTNLLNDTIAKSIIATASADSLWIVGVEGNPGDLVQVEVWLQYGGGGPNDSISGFDIPLTWDATICTVEAITIGPDFAGWTDTFRIDNIGTDGPPAVSKMLVSAYTWGPPIGPPWVEGCVHHLAATVDLRIFDTATPGDSACIDTLMQAFSPPRYLEFEDKYGIYKYVPEFSGNCVRVSDCPCGDCNRDGKVTFADALHVKNYYYQTPPGASAPWCNCDVNLDTKVNFADALYIKNYYYQTPPGSPAPCEPPKAGPFRERRMER